MAQLHKLSRRDFLKVSGLTTAGMALAACAPAQVNVESPVANSDEAYKDCWKGISGMLQTSL